MMRCWLEGDWRAFYDRELPPEEMAAGERHLQECDVCALLYQDISTRAERVSNWMREVDVMEPLPRIEPVRMARSWHLAVAMTAGLAAALLAGIWLWPRQTGQRIAVEPPIPRQIAIQTPPAPAPVPKPAPMAAAVAHRPVRPARVNRMRSPAAPVVTRVDHFTPLDNEPLDSGVIVRLALDDSGRQADVLLDSFGRPRGVRLVNSGFQRR
jgi:hypothetical protein